MQMESVDEIELSAVMQTDITEEVPVTPDNPELNSTNNLPTISTDNLPITPLRNKRWLSNASESQNAGISLNLTPTSISPIKSQDNEKPLYIESPPSRSYNLTLPNTDNLLDINVPKTTLLGKHQAKKRLHAFSLNKQNSLNASPLNKKKNVREPKYLLQENEDKYNENGEKTDAKFVLIKRPARKTANPTDKAKAVVEEIEEIKKIESAYLEALEQGLLEPRNRRSRSTSRSRERNKRRSSRKEHRRSRSVEVKPRKSVEKPKYPTNWTEMNHKGYTFETVLNMKPKEFKTKDNEPFDFRKMLLFQTPSLPVCRLTVKTVNGKERIIPPECIRFTNKSPRISYSTKENMPNDYFSRKCVLQYVPKSYQHGMKRMINNTMVISNSEVPIKVTNRKWFPKTILNKSDDSTECKIIENSLGLSFLQNYSDGDEQEKEVNEEKEEKIKETKVEEVETKVQVLYSEEEMEEKVVKCEKVKKHKKKEKKKHKSKPKKEKRKKKKKKSKIIKENKHEKVKKRKNSTADEDKKKQPEKVDDGHKNKQDESNKSSKRTRCHSNDTKTKARSSSKEEKSSKPSKSKKRTSSEGTDKSVKEEPRKDPKPESSTKQHPKKNKPEEIVEKREKHAAKHKSRSTSREKKPKSTEKPSKIKSPKPESETKKIKCVAEKEFGTPDTDEYYSNWESDVELSNSEKSRRNESTSINQSWQSDEDQLEISDDIPLVKSPFQIIKSPQQNKEEVKRTYKRDKSVEEKRRPSLRDRSPLRPRHLDTFPIELSPIQNELQSSPPENDFSPFRNRIEDRRRSRRSMERSPEKFLEMPLNIRNTRYSRKPWEEERFEDKYNRSPEHVENKVYALFSENAWERDDYLTIQSEEIKLEEERRTLIEERRKLEIERRKFQELERQRYYNRMTEFDEKRCGFEERRQEEFKMSDDEDKRYRSHRDYRETREPHPQYSQEIDVPSRRSCEDQRSRRRYSPEPPRERTRDDFNWEDTTDNSKRVEKYVEKPQDQDSTKKRRKSRWQNLDDLEPIHEATYTKTEGNKSDSVAPNKPEQKSYSKEKKISKRDRWESSEDETIIRDDKKSVDKPSNKQEQHKKLKDVNKSKEKRDREKPKRTSKKEEENKQKSLTDNLDLPPHKPISRTPSIKKPEILENEYEKFMQALGSEISTAEEISDKDFEHKRKSTEKRNKKHKSYSRSVSISSDEEFEKHTTKEMRKRKVKKRISSSSSSSTSSTTSGTDSSTDSSSLSSSSDFSSDEEKTKKLKKRKVEGVKVKMEDIESEETEQTDTNLGNFDVITVNRIKGKEIAEVIKIEDPDDKLNTNAKSVTTPHKMIGANLNIINLTIPEFTTSPEKALPSHEALKALVKPFEAPQPVPSPKLSLIIPINEPVLPKIEPLVPKMEPPVHTFPKTEPETAKTIPTLPAIVPVPPVIQFSTNLSSFESEINDLNTGPDISAIKEEPTTPEENKFEENPALIDVLNTPTKRSNIIPIKFLTAELRKQASESSPHIISLGNIESKEIIPTNPVLIDVKTSMDNKIEVIESLPLTNRKRHFALSCINVPAKRPLLEGSDNEENSTDFTDKFKRQDDTLDEVSTSSAQFIEIIEMRNQAPLRQSPKMRERSFERDRTSNEPSKERKKQRSISPRRKREFSPRRRDSRSPRRQDLSKRWSRDVSPRRRERDLSPRGPRMSSPGRWDRNGSPRRSSRDRSTRRSRDDLHRRHSTSPGQRDGRRDYRSISPGLKKRLSPRHRSPSRRSMSREFSPRRHRSKDRSSSKDHKLESIQETLQRIAGVDKYRIKHSPISSPLHGFKRSVADSTISDDQLLQHNSEEYTASPSYSNTTEFFKNSVTHTSSPKRMSLDERISQALGLAADQQPKPISTTYSANYECDAQYFDQYGQYYEQYDEQNKKSETFSQSNKSYRATRQRENSNLKVVQVGNVLQVVPIEDAPPKPKPPPVQQNKVTNSTQKIVQVGNMLQIVPTATLPDIPVEVPIVPPLPPLPVSPTPSPPTPLATTIKDPLNAETLIKQKAERRAEKDNRRQEREKKRKEKEKKRKEREKRKQFKAKMQTEAMIKQALIKETEETPVGNEENLNLEGPIECQQAPVQWPPVPQIVCNNLYKPAGKGILSQGSRGNLNEEGEYKRKTVKFSDGVMPGEGTSPSGGEELSSPPPAPKKLPKEKRFIKTKVPKKVKVPKKKKVKVKVIRQQQTQGIDDDEDEDDNLPPPPPPPGSPPPHLFPARIKQPVINNIHPNVVVSIANQPLQLTNTSYPPPSVYRPTQPPVIMPHHHGHHHGPPHLPLHGHGHHHHPPPCPPPHHVGFNPPTVVVPPVISVVPSIPAVVAPCYPPQHSHHHHHGGPHHHHSPHHHGHHHH